MVFPKIYQAHALMTLPKYLWPAQNFITILHDIISNLTAKPSWKSYHSSYKLATCSGLELVFPVIITSYVIIVIPIDNLTSLVIPLAFRSNRLYKLLIVCLSPCLASKNKVSSLLGTIVMFFFDLAHKLSMLSEKILPLKISWVD